MNNDYMLNLCKNVVRDYVNTKFGLENGFVITNDSVYIVWFCKTLQNFKALVSTDIEDGMYYEVTYNGDKKELYLDAYKKQENVVNYVQEKESN